MHEPCQIQRTTGTEAAPRAARRFTLPRSLTRAAALTAVVVFLLPLGATAAAAYVAAASPLVAIASVVAAREFSVPVIAGLILAGVVFVRHRWFCRRVCPMGLCADAASNLGRHLPGRRPNLPRVGIWLAMAVLGSAVLGYPLFLWLDPLALLSGVFSIGGPARSAGAWAAALGLPVVLLLSVCFPGAWCSRCCPLGGLQDALHGWPRRHRPRQDNASDPAQHAPHTLGRRSALAAVVGAACAFVTRRSIAAAAPPLRPPGARASDVFTGLCIRCGNCLRACPSEIIVPERGERGIAGLFAPQLTFAADYCREDCVRCTTVCPSGAIERLAKKDKAKAVIGLARVDMNVCRLGNDEECSACSSACPFDAVRYVFDEVEYTLTPKIDPQRCPGCGACEVACPTAPKAIVVRPVE